MPIKDPQKRKAYLKNWREANREGLRRQKQAYYQQHQDSRDQKTNGYREKHPWLRFYVNAKQRCENPKCPGYKWYGAKGIKFRLTLAEVKRLWLRDNAGKLKNPSLDRKKSSLDYTYSNCRFIDRWLNATKKVDSK